MSSNTSSMAVALRSIYDRIAAVDGQTDDALTIYAISCVLEKQEETMRRAVSVMRDAALEIISLRGMLEESRNVR